MERIHHITRPLSDQGASRVVIYDSVGTMLPSQMTRLVAEIRRSGSPPVLVHCHNDYGLATANSLAAIEGGAEAVDVAVNGVGGRAGNAALEEVALALENLSGLETGIDTRRLKELSSFVEQMTGLKNSPLKPIVGDYCFVHLPMMHVRCIAGGNPRAFEPFDPHQVGQQRTYGFSLPVDYGPAIEPFVRSSGCQVAAKDYPALIDAIRHCGDGGTLTEQQIVHCIQQFKARSTV